MPPLCPAKEGNRIREQMKASPSQNDGKERGGDGKGDGTCMGRASRRSWRLGRTSGLRPAATAIPECKEHPCHCLIEAQQLSKDMHGVFALALRAAVDHCHKYSTTCSTPLFELAVTASQSQRDQDAKSGQFHLWSTGVVSGLRRANPSMRWKTLEKEPC